MKLTPSSWVHDLDLPFIESPSAAVGRVKRLLENDDLWGLDAIRRELDLSFTADRARVWRRILEEVERGGLLLIMGSLTGWNGPLSALVVWDGGAWRSRALNSGAFRVESLVAAMLPRLNARGLSPAGVAGARFPVHGLAPSAPAPRQAPPPPALDPSPPDERLLHIGVFFDGTGNHRDNDRQLTDRDITNVVKLHDLYLEDDDHRRVYAHGVGTLSGRPGEDGFDAPGDALGLAMGIGPEGGHARIELALTQLRSILAENPDATVVFDVFGFSRGAALARHFVNLIHRWPASLFMPNIDPLSLEPRLPVRRIEAFPPGRIPAPRVRFVGLFDTVASFYWPGNDQELDFELHLAPGSAQRVVQLTAFHEMRRNFPLTSLADARGRLPGHFSEIALPGVHSDIGGGYENPEVDFANHEELVVRYRTGLGANGTTVRRAQQQAAARGLEIRVEGMDVVEIERRATRKELAIHVLRRMYRLAKEAGVPLDDLRNNAEHTIPGELQAALDAWQAAGGRLEDSRHYLQGYLHTSHRPGSLPHAPERSGVRSVFANRPAAAEKREPQDA